MRVKKPSMLRMLERNQRGFTLIEVLIAIAITALITGAITMTIFQVFAGNIRTSNHMVAVRQVQNAGYWISHDGLRAQRVVTENLAPPKILRLTWTEWPPGTVNHQVTYTLVDGDLRRSHSVNGGAPSVTIVAQFIESIEVGPRPFIIGGVLTLRVTATVQGQSETRVYEIMPRAGL